MRQRCRTPRALTRTRAGSCTRPSKRASPVKRLLKRKPPDAAGASLRFPALEARAKDAGVRITRLKKALRAAKKEIAAQEALLAMDWDDEKERKLWLARHRRTSTGKWVKESLWK